MNKNIQDFLNSLPSPVVDHPQALLQPRQENDWNESQAMIFNFLKDSDTENKKPLNMLGTVAHHEKLFDVFMPMASLLGADTLVSRRQLELLALRVIWRAGSVYEWAHHYDYGIEAGLTEAEIQLLLQEAISDEWSEVDKLLIRAADELVMGHAAKPATLAGLRLHFNDAEIVEILFLVNQYNGLSKVANTLGIQPEAGYNE